MHKLILLFTLLFGACAPEEAYKGEDVGAAGAAATANAQRIATGVGVLSEPLTGTSYTKDRIKQRYGSTVRWTETSTQLKGTSTCRDYEVEFQGSGAPLTLQYRVWLKRKANSTPTSTEGCLPFGSLVAFVWYEDIRCPIPGGQLGPCWRIDAPAAKAPTPEESSDGAGAGLATAVCDQYFLQNAAWNYFKSLTGNPTCDRSVDSSQRFCVAGPLTWLVNRTLQNATPPNNQVWYAVDANYTNGDFAFTCKYAQQCTSIACKKL